MEQPMSHPRLNYRTASPDAYALVGAAERYFQSCGLEKSLIELVKLRASQINGCAYCLDMHSRDARRDGETEQRLYVLAAWRESPAFTPRERAALAWTESLTLIAAQGAPDDVYATLEAYFSPKEIVDLTMLIGQINLLNRLAVGMRSQHPVAAAA
jgi:AhpD family alkylhydroperoxidase